MSKRVLVVDDLEDDRSAMVDIIKRLMRLTAFEAMNGREAIRLAAQIRPNLILLDLHMPPFDGWEVVGILRQMEGFGDTPIVAVTSFDGAIPDLRERALAAGCNDYLTKPLDIDAFIEMVNESLSA